MPPIIMVEHGPSNLEVSPEQMRQEAKRLLEAAAADGVVLRLLGALAFEHHSNRYRSLREELGRVLSDLDFVALSSQWQQLTQFMEGMGYSFDERYAMLHSNERLIFFHRNGFRVDVFLDRLDMCHVVDFRGRLEIDPVTISITDLLLEKLQIVQLTGKDVIDILVLLLEQDVGDSEDEINAPYMAQLLARDWGFYYTATENLKYLRDKALEEYPAVGKRERQVIRNKIDELLERVEAEPKSRLWRIRAAIGPRVRWYQEVGDLER